MGWDRSTSPNGEGTTFRIYLPPTAFTELKVEDETPMQTEVLTGTETVLVAEDEPALRKLISLCLEARGYTVFAAEDGTEAIRIMENNPGKIDLVVSDIMMPKLNGLELMKRSALLRPEVRFLLISGYMEDTPGTSRKTLATWESRSLQLNWRARAANC